MIECSLVCSLLVPEPPLLSNQIQDVLELPPQRECSVTHLNQIPGGIHRT